MTFREKLAHIIARHRNDSTQLASKAMLDDANTVDNIMGLIALEYPMPSKFKCGRCGNKLYQLDDVRRCMSCGSYSKVIEIIKL